MHHGSVSMNADESEKNRAAVEMRTQQGNLDLTQEATEGPVVAHGEVHRHHGSDGGGEGVAEGQMELQSGSRSPAGHTAAEDPQAEGVEEEAHEEDNAQENGDGHMLALPQTSHRGVAAAVVHML